MLFLLEMAKKVRVLIADDHALFAEALQAILTTDKRIHVVGRARDGLATKSGDGEENEPGDDKSGAGHQRRRNGTDGDPDRQICGPPDDADDGKRSVRERAIALHVRDYAQELRAKRGVNRCAANICLVAPRLIPRCARN